MSNSFIRNDQIIFLFILETRKIFRFGVRFVDLGRKRETQEAGPRRVFYWYSVLLLIKWFMFIDSSFRENDEKL